MTRIRVKDNYPAEGGADPLDLAMRGQVIDGAVRDCPTSSYPWSAHYNRENWLFMDEEVEILEVD